MSKILFLEDEEIIREVLTEYMLVAGYDVVGCSNGDEAIKVLDEGEALTEDAEKTGIDLAVLDINVKGSSGIEVLKHIRKTTGHRLGVIMLTAYDDVNMQLEAFNSFADDYITKPASPIILLKRIEAVLRRTKQLSEKEHAQKNAEWDEKELYVDEDGYEASYKGNKLGLTVSEFLLLKTLKSQPGRVFTREQLINNIFNDEYIGNDRIIDAHVKNLRKKLPEPWIETVVGVGYKWRA